MQSPPVTQSPVLRRTLQQDGIAGGGRFAYLNNRNPMAMIAPVFGSDYDLGARLVAALVE